MDFIDKKEKLADMIEDFLENPENANELLAYINELSNDSDFKDKPLFTTIFNELSVYLNELSRKEIKQRVMMIRTYLE